MPAVGQDGNMSLCHDCHEKLSKNQIPPLSIANNMWIGNIPFELSVLTLLERMLIAKYLPAAYIVKLYPKSEDGQYLDSSALNSKLQGNVLTYHLDQEQIAHMIKGNQMPQSVEILAVVIGVTFVGLRNLPECSRPKMFIVWK